MCVCVCIDEKCAYTVGCCVCLQQCHYVIVRQQKKKEDVFKSENPTRSRPSSSQTAVLSYRWQRYPLVSTADALSRPFSVLDQLAKAGAPHVLS